MNRRTSSWEGESLEALKRRWDRPQVHLYSRVDSTNTRAKELADEGAPAGTLVLADEQTGGRGVEDRGWHSPKGAGLYLSLVLRPTDLPNPLLMPLLAGLGVARAVQRLVDDLKPAVKWPNDLIVADRKAGGVLSEASWAGETPKHVVLGVGINVHGQESDFPKPLRETAISLEMAAGRPLSRLELADLVLEEVEDRCADPPESLDQDVLRRMDEYDWLRDRHCRLLKADGQEVQGTAVGVAPDGALLFRPDRGALVRITSGRVRADDLPLPDY